MIKEKLSEQEDELSAIKIDLNHNNTLLEDENKRLAPLRDKRMESLAKVQKLNLDMTNLNEEEARVKGLQIKLLKSLEKEGVYIDFTGFSLLKGKTEIEPHTDTKKPNFYPKSIHYGLSVPENCYIIIDGNYFDDSLLHSAYNDSKENRFILYIKLV